MYSRLPGDHLVLLRCPSSSHSLVSLMCCQRRGRIRGPVLMTPGNWAAQLELFLRQGAENSLAALTRALKTVVMFIVAISVAPVPGKLIGGAAGKSWHGYQSVHSEHVNSRYASQSASCQSHVTHCTLMACQKMSTFLEIYGSCHSYMSSAGARS